MALQRGNVGEPSLLMKRIRSGVKLGLRGISGLKAGSVAERDFAGGENRGRGRALFWVRSTVSLQFSLLETRLNRILKGIAAFVEGVEPGLAL